MLDCKGNHIDFDDCDICEVIDDNDGVIAFHFDNNAVMHGYITISDEEIELMYLSIKCRKHQNPSQ